MAEKNVHYFFSFRILNETVPAHVVCCSYGSNIDNISRNGSVMKSFTAVVYLTLMVNQKLKKVSKNYPVTLMF